jgi:autotransporter-associated beta strand protein
VQNGAKSQLIYDPGSGVNTTVTTLSVGNGNLAAQLTLKSGTLTSPGVYIGNNGSVLCTLIVDGGDLTLNSTNNLSLNNTASADSVLTIVNGTVTVRGIALKNGTTYGSTVNLNGGTLAMGAGGVSLSSSSAGGTAPRAFNFNGGTLKTTAILGALAADTVNVRNGGAIVDTNGFDSTFGWALAHSNVGGDSATDGGLTKKGARTLTLSASNTYNGPTVVSAGTLALSNASTATISGLSALSVASGAIFSDGYTTGRNLTFAGLGGGGTLNAGSTGSRYISAGTLAPGDAGIGTLTIGKGSLEVGAGAIYDFQIGGTTLAPTADLIYLTGSGSTVTFDGSWTLNLSNVGTVDPTGKTFVLFQSASPITSAGTSSVDLPVGWHGGTISTSGNQVLLSNITVPEPATGGVLLSSMLLVLKRRRRA